MKLVLMMELILFNRLVEYQSNNESFCLSILLNSGDRINILTSKVIYSET